MNFYPRPPRGGRPLFRHFDISCSLFLSTSPAWGTTVERRANIPAQGHFYPRPPRGGRHWETPQKDSTAAYFYPRPPRGGRPAPTTAAAATTHFYPRPPRGGRRRPLPSPATATKFLSTSPAWGTTFFFQGVKGEEVVFLSTSPAWGTTCPSCRRSVRPSYFYPRPPRGGRPVYMPI